MDQIARAFQRVIGSTHITLGAEVQSVHQDDRGVRVTYAGRGNRRQTAITADYVVVCMPFSVLSGFGWSN
jgi:monoamine oxidase